MEPERSDNRAKLKIKIKKKKKIKEHEAQAASSGHNKFTASSRDLK